MYNHERVIVSPITHYISSEMNSKPPWLKLGYGDPGWDVFSLGCLSQGLAALVNGDSEKRQRRCLGEFLGFEFIFGSRYICYCNNSTTQKDGHLSGHLKGARKGLIYA